MMQLQRTAAKQRETGGNLASTRVLGLRGMQEQVLREVRWYSFGQAKRRGSKERLQKNTYFFEASGDDDQFGGGSGGKLLMASDTPLLVLLIGALLKPVSLDCVRQFGQLLTMMTKMTMSTIEKEILRRPRGVLCERWERKQKKRPPSESVISSSVCTFLFLP